MKKLALVFALIVGIGLGTFYYFERPSKPKVDPTLTEKTFAHASEADRAAVQKVVDAINAKEYGKALVLLDELTYDLEDPSADNQAVLMDLTLQVTDMLGDQAETAKEKAQKALDEAADAAPDATPDSASEDATNVATQAAAGAAQAADAVKAAAGQAAEDAAKAAKELPNPLKQ